MDANEGSEEIPGSHDVDLHNRGNVPRRGLRFPGGSANHYADSAAYILIVEKTSQKLFSDVQDPGHAYYNAIYWAADAGITKGYADGSFGINRNCTRGECMMFLWRLKGKPAPKAVAKAPFPDVPKSHVFYNAVLWGYQKNITTGFTSGPLAGKFGVNENCSRGQIVTFLYRAKSL